MKILFFHRWTGVHAGGTETHLLELAKRFSGFGHQVSILTRQGDRLQDLDPGIRVIRVSRNPGESDHSYRDARVYLHTLLFMGKALFKLIALRLKGERFDIISVHFTTEAVVARIYRFLFRTPFIFILEGYTPLEAQTARYANVRIAISAYEAGVYRQRHAVTSEVIHVGVDRSRFSLNKEAAMGLRRKLAADDELLVLTVCRLEPRKDLFTLLEAAKMVRRRNRKIKFIVVGDGISRAELEEKINRENLGGFINLSGPVSDEQLPYYYAAGDIFALTSKEEWFGIVFLEAMAAGLPVIATNVDACPEVVGAGGLFFEKGDYRALAEKILELSGDPGLRQALSQKAKERAMEFDWDKQARLYEKAYQNALGARNV